MNRSFTKVYAHAFGVFLVVEGVWLVVMGPLFYTPALAEFAATNIHWGAAILFYFVYVLGLTYFVIYPNRENTPSKRIFFDAGLWSFIAYATYDLTNLATIENWPVSVTVVDLVWSVVLATAVTGLTLKLLQNK